MGNIVEIPVGIEVKCSYGNIYVVENESVSDILDFELELIGHGQPFFIVPIYNGDIDSVPDFSKVESRNVVKPTYCNGELPFKSLQAIGDKLMCLNRMIGYKVVVVRNLSKGG